MPEAQDIAGQVVTRRRRTAPFITARRLTAQMQALSERTNISPAAVQNMLARRAEEQTVGTPWYQRREFGSLATIPAGQQGPEGATVGQYFTPGFAASLTPQAVRVASSMPVRTWETMSGRERAFGAFPAWMGPAPYRGEFVAPQIGRPWNPYVMVPQNFWTRPDIPSQMQHEFLHGMEASQPSGWRTRMTGSMSPQQQQDLLNFYGETNAARMFPTALLRREVYPSAIQATGYRPYTLSPQMRSFYSNVFRPGAFRYPAARLNLASAQRGVWRSFLLSTNALTARAASASVGSAIRGTANSWSLWAE